ncbi:hypothetical protein NG99_22360 [Erwinia typographi]|uniref:Uncharacterized protein n=1 Tax=Erwinia typographi TaxID=371042 RepID=A0A0A3YMP0_9GAMM|nr:hypothetical protein [Erwinia typographi]KGT88047.1 hypothetical protein NG99_22360 [Erwinia typographi]
MNQALQAELAGFMAGEIGEVVVELAKAGEVISRDSIIKHLEVKLRDAGNVIYKGALKDALVLLRKGR